VSDILLAYRAIKAQKAREKALKQFIGKEPDYLVIKSLFDQARVDIIATITFPNGMKLDFKKADAFDKLQQQMMDPDRAGSY
jgi:hypothetical protein